MSSMGTFVVLGLLVFGLGSAAIISAVLPDDESLSHEFLPAEDEYLLTSTSLTWGGKIVVWYYEPNNLAVNLSILTESQYKKHLTGEVHGVLLTVTGTGGTVTCDLDGMNKYYILIERAPGTTGNPVLSISYELQGLPVFHTVGALVAMAVGTLFLAFAWRVRGSRGIAELSPRPSDLANTSGWISFKWPGKR